MIRKGYSFDDVLLVPRYNDIPSRRDVDTSMKFDGLNLRIPVLSSNMDTVTGIQMAKTMCYLGGLGVMHRFCTIDENVQMFRQLGTGNGGGGGHPLFGDNLALWRAGGRRCKTCMNERKQARRRAGCGY